MTFAALDGMKTIVGLGMGLVWGVSSCGGVSDSAPNSNSGGTSSVSGSGSGSAGVETTVGGSGPTTGGSGGLAGATCNCEQIDVDGAHQPLECECTDDCPTEEEVVIATTEMAGPTDVICSGQGLVDLLLTTGCGVRALRLSHRYYGFEYFFDDSTGELLGVRRWSDAQYGTCLESGVGRYAYGDVPAECPEAVVCNACPDAVGSLSSYPPCE